jgi:hypothetical protein
MHSRLLPIVQPCGEDWSGMRADGDGRRCERCATTVVDLSAMTEAQAKRTIARGARAGGELCVRYRRDADGEVRFAAEPPRRGSRAVALGLGLLSVICASGAAHADNSVPPCGSGDGSKPPVQQPSQPPTGVKPPPAPPQDRDPHAQRPHRPSPPPKDPDNYVMGKLAAPNF